MRVRQKSKPGSYQLLLDDVSSWQGGHQNSKPRRSSNKPKWRAIPAMAAHDGSKDNAESSASNAFTLDWTAVGSPTAGPAERCLMHGSRPTTHKPGREDPATLSAEITGSSFCGTSVCWDSNDGCFPGPDADDRSKLKSTPRRLDMPRLNNTTRKRPFQKASSPRSLKYAKLPTRSEKYLLLRDTNTQQSNDMAVGGSEATVLDSDGDGNAKRPGFPCPFSVQLEQHSRSSSRLCSHSPLPDPRAVASHLFHQHQRRPICPVCGANFVTYAACDEHIVSRSCALTEVPPVAEGLTEAQANWLESCMDSSLPEAEQYRRIWRVVFPGTEPPPS